MLKFYCFRSGSRISFKWWEKYLSKFSLIKHCSWRDNLLYYEHWTDRQKYFYICHIMYLNKAADLLKSTYNLLLPPGIKWLRFTQTNILGFS